MGADPSRHACHTGISGSDYVTVEHQISTTRNSSVVVNVNSKFFQNPLLSTNVFLIHLTPYENPEILSEIQQSGGTLIMISLMQTFDLVLRLLARSNYRPIHILARLISCCLLPFILTGTRLLFIELFPIAMVNHIQVILLSFYH